MGKLQTAPDKKSPGLFGCTLAFEGGGRAEDRDEHCAITSAEHLHETEDLDDADTSNDEDEPEDTAKLEPKSS
ncbi:hypothetical protein AOLI_G00005870 [Acnodon oligacanthus]